jgi:hypothetical protein
LKYLETVGYGLGTTAKTRGVKGLCVFFKRHVLIYSWHMAAGRGNVDVFEKLWD